jgi:hypothetical protein
MKKNGDRPQRNMVSSIPRPSKDLIGNTKREMSFSRQTTSRSIDADLGNLNFSRQTTSRSIDADLGNLNSRKPMTSGIRPHPNQSNVSSSPSQPMTSRQQKQAASLMTTKGYIRTATPASSATPQSVKNPKYMAADNTDTSPVDFPIDLVYTWVDGSDEEWIKIRRQFQPTQKNIPDDSLLTCRWRDFDELRLSIDSVQRFAPWIRTIFIISDFQRPYWYDENNPGKIKFVDHPELFQEYEEHLPTFNSHAIETHIHRIPGLAEHFIYANDDTFFGNDVYPLDFFTSDGRFKVFLTINDMETEKSLKEYAKQTPKPPVVAMVNAKVNPKVNYTSPPPPAEKNDIIPYFTAQAITNLVMDNVFGPASAPRKRLKHQMKAFRKSTFEWCWDNEMMQLYLFNTSSTRFRSLSDIDATSLVSHVGLAMNMAVPASISSKFYGIQDTTDVRQVFQHLFKFRPTPKLYCINDSLVEPTDEMLNTIRIGMDKYLPHVYLK